MKLSILICSLENRKKKLEHLLSELNNQIATFNLSDTIEVLVEIDNKRITTGAKRNILLWRSIGKYIVFIDDDDHVTPNYLRLILEATNSDCDCIGTNGYYTINGGGRVDWKLSKDYEDCDSYDNGKLIYLRRTNHISPVKRELALLAMFPDKSNAEDKEYSYRLNKHLKTETKIEEHIYHYDYSTENKEYR